MRHFVGLIAAAYVVVGLCAGAVHYHERDTHTGPEAARERFAVEAFTAAALWPAYIVDILARYDPRELS